MAYAHLPRQCHLEPEMNENVKQMLQVKANKKLIQNHLLQTTAQVATLKVIHKVDQQMKPTGADNNLHALLQVMRNDEGSFTDVSVNDKNVLQAIFLSRSGHVLHSE